MNDKELSFKNIFIKGAVIFNPVLIQFAGLCPVIAASASLKSSLILSAVLCLDLIITCVVASALLKKVSRWLRMPIYLLIGLLIICPLLYFAENSLLTDLSLSMRIYIPLIAVNSVTAVHCEQFAVKNSVRAAFYDAAAVGLGASAVFIICGVIRELFGSGTVAGVPVSLPVTLKAAAMPFGCLILLGFLSALLRAFTKRFYPEYFSQPKSEKSNEPKREEEKKAVPEKPKAVPEKENLGKISFDDYEELLRSVEAELNEKEGGK